MDEFFNLVKIIGVLLGMPTACLIGLTARKMIREEAENLAERLEHDLIERRRIRAWLIAVPFDEFTQRPIKDEGWIQVYYRRIRRGLVWLSRSFGRRRGWQLRSFLFCLGLSLIYSAWFFWVGWAVFNSEGLIGNVALLPSEATLSQRIIPTVLIIFFSILIGILIRNSKEIDQFFVNYFTNFADRLRLKPSRRIGRTLYRIFVGFSIFAAFLYFIFTWPWESEIVPSQLITVAFAGAGAGLVAAGRAGNLAYAFALVLIGVADHNNFHSDPQ